MLQIRSSVTYVYFFKHAFCHTCNILRNTTYRRHNYPWRKMTAIARLFSVGVLQVFLATSCVTLQWRAVVRSKHVLFTYINTAAICIDDIYQNWYFFYPQDYRVYFASVLKIWTKYYYSKMLSLAIHAGIKDNVCSRTRYSTIWNEKQLRVLCSLTVVAP